MQPSELPNVRNIQSAGPDSSVYGARRFPSREKGGQQSSPEWNSRSVVLVALILLLAPLTGCGDDTTGPEGQATSTRQLFDQAELPGIRGVSVAGINGEIEIGTGAVERISIEMALEVRARNQREADQIAGSVRIEAEQVGPFLQIRADYPEPPAEVVVEANWNVTIPSGMAVSLATINGAISVRGRVGALDAEIQNGSVVLRGSMGPVDISTINGAYDVDLETLTGAGVFTSVNGLHSIDIASGNASISSSATNGEIYLGLSSSYSGVLDAMTANGEVTCTLPLEDLEVSTSTHLLGRLGDGGAARVELRTVNGRIAVDRYQGG